MEQINKLSLFRKIFRSKKYDYKIYWTQEGKGYFTNYSKLDESIIRKYDTQANLIIKFLSDLKFSSVCEAGCGFGRVTKKIIDNFNITKDRYLAFDLSEDQINNARELVGDKAQFTVSTINDLNTNQKYDLVLASEVLMHIPHEHIESNISKLVDISSKYIVNIDWKETDSRKSSFVNFAHDYKKLYENLGLNVKVIKLDEFANLKNNINQTMYLAQK